MMNPPDDDNGDAGNGGTMADDVAEELQRHGDAMANIMAEHGVAAPDEGEGSQQD
jgi:hypothetical protein